MLSWPTSPPSPPRTHARVQACTVHTGEGGWGGTTAEMGPCYHSDVCMAGHRAAHGGGLSAGAIAPHKQGTEQLERFWNDCSASGMPHSVWSWPVATGRSTCMDVQSFKETQGVTGRVYPSIFIHWNKKHSYLVQCSSSIRIRSDTSKRTTADHARKTNARSRHAAP